MTSFQKIFQNREFLEQEIAGYTFFEQYYHMVPSIISIGELSCSIDYEDISSSKNNTLFLMLRNNQCINMSNTFTELAEIARKNSKLSSEIAGGTKKFYTDRLYMLQSEQLINKYKHFLAQQKPNLVNSLVILKKDNTLSYIQTFTENLERTYVIPSQGDFHDMNIFQNGYIVDFEAAGWNRLSTDIATFLHHALFGGNYFGPKYAKWSDNLQVKHTKEVALTKEESIRVDVNSARKKLVKQYMCFYVGSIDNGVVSEIDHEICVMIALRLLTVFDVTKMSTEDSEITFSLVNYFLSDDSLERKLAPFLE